MGGGGSTTVEAPKPSAEEKALQAQQTALLQQQTAILQQNLKEQELLAPYLYKSAGLEPIYSREASTFKPGTFSAQQQAQIKQYDAQISNLYNQRATSEKNLKSSRRSKRERAQQEVNSYNAQINALQGQKAQVKVPDVEVLGKQFISGYRELPATAEETAQKALQQKFLERSLAQMEAESQQDPVQNEIKQRLNQRSLAALKGELPVDPTVMRSLEEGETGLRERLFKQLGGGYETSTPGIQALAEFQKRKQEVLAGASRAELTLGEQLGLARSQAEGQTTADYFNSQQLGQSLKQSRLGNIMAFSQGPTQQAMQGFGQITQGYNSPISWFQNNRQQQMNASIANAQSAAQSQAGFGQLLGTGMMAGAMYF